MKASQKESSSDKLYTIILLTVAVIILLLGMYKEWLQFQVMIKYLRG